MECFCGLGCSELIRVGITIWVCLILKTSIQSGVDSLGKGVRESLFSLFIRVLFFVVDLDLIFKYSTYSFEIGLDQVVVLWLWYYSQGRIDLLLAHFCCQ